MHWSTSNPFPVSLSTLLRRTGRRPRYTCDRTGNPIRVRCANWRDRSTAWVSSRRRRRWRWRWRRVRGTDEQGFRDERNGGTGAVELIYRGPVDRCQRMRNWYLTRRRSPGQRAAGRRRRRERRGGGVERDDVFNSGGGESVGWNPRNPRHQHKSSSVQVYRRVQRVRACPGVRVFCDDVARDTVARCSRLDHFSRPATTRRTCRKTFLIDVRRVRRERSSCWRIFTHLLRSNANPRKLYVYMINSVTCFSARLPTPQSLFSVVRFG